MRRLLIRPGAIGDFIVSLPALQFLASGETEVWARAEVLPLIGFAQRVRSIASAGVDTVGLDGVEAPSIVWERLAEFDEIHSWYGANRDSFREAVRHLPFQFYGALPPDGASTHAVDFYAEQVGCAPGQVPALGLEAPRRSDIVIHPFASGRRKEWPLPYFQRTAALLDSEVAWCAGPEDRLDGAVRIERLDDLGRWIAGASAYIGNDSGIAHLAAAVGTPVVALFGPTDPAVWAPRGPAVRILRMESVTPERVASAVREIRREPA